MNKVIKLILQIVLALVVAGLQLFACTVAWKLIAVPMGAHPIDLTQALGLGWLISLLSYDGRTRQEQSFTQTISNNFVHTGIVMGLVYLFFGR